MNFDVTIREGGMAMTERLSCGCVLHKNEDGFGAGWIESCPSHQPACDRLGFTDDHYAALTGFSGRAFRGLAHLREAWAGADAQNAQHVAAAIRELRLCHSLADTPGMVRLALSAGLDRGQAEELLRVTSPA